MSRDWLFPDDKTVIAVRDPSYKDEETGGWYIAAGKPGFNSPTNNRGGYKTEQAAIRASAGYKARGDAHRAEMARKRGR